MTTTTSHPYATSPAPAVSAPASASGSPLQIELAFRLACSPELAFSLVTQRLPEWFSAIHAVRWDHAASHAGSGQLGVCSQRTCDFNGKALKEEIVEYVPGVRYAYRVDLAASEMKMPIRDHLGTFEVAADGSGTKVTWRQYFRAAWYVPAAMLRWQMRDKMMRPAVEELLRQHGGNWL